MLACIYAPNWDDSDFFSNLFYLPPDLNSHHLILGADFNCVLNHTVDRSAIPTRPLSNSARVVNSFVEDNGMVDPWRFKNPTVKQFSFSS